jgi:lipopolysaccharide biosynthesis glycosyltransferase
VLAEWIDGGSVNADGHTFKIGDGKANGPKHTEASVKEVFLCADNNFVVPLAVTLRSLAESQDTHSDLHITVFSLGIPPEEQTRLQVSSRPLSVEFISIEEHVQLELPSMRHLSRATYGRLVAVDLLPPGIHRAVYLDSDIIVRSNLDYLFSFDLGASPIAASQDLKTPHVSNWPGLRQWRSLGLSPTTPYMNAGVLVIDVEAWRAIGLGNAICDFALKHREYLSLADQDGFNGVLAGNFARLPLRWNQGSPLRRSNHFAYSLFAEAEVDEAINNPAIIHFTGSRKPWQRNCDDPATLDWLKLLDSTEYRGYEPPRPRNRERALHLLRKILRV